MGILKNNYLYIFIFNSIVSYFAISLIRWSLPIGKVYIFFILSIITSHIVFTILPRSGKTFLLNFILKAGLHILTAYILMIIFANIEL
jgi:hypothetical protein